jgi:hypothetical protein
MDFSKLSSNDKLAVIGAVLAIVGSVVSFGAGPYGVLTGIAMLVIIFLPQFSPSTKLPGTKGSLMLIVGGAAGIGAVLTLLAWLPYLGVLGTYFIGGLLGIAGGLLMGWASWQTFQAEGGKFNMGMSSGPSAPPAPPGPPAPPPPPPGADGSTNPGADERPGARGPSPGLTPRGQLPRSGQQPVNRIDPVVRG